MCILSVGVSFVCLLAHRRRHRRRQNRVGNTHNIKAVAAVGIYKIFQFSTLSGSACRRKIKHSLHGPVQGSWGERRPKLPLLSRRSRLVLGQLLTLHQEDGGDAVPQAASGGDAVPQGGGGERSADLYTRHTIRETCLNRAGLLRCLSAIHS